MLTQATSQSWNLSTAAHLLNRAGFGGKPDAIAALHAMGRRQAIEYLLSPQPAVDVPEFANTDEIYLAKLNARMQRSKLSVEERRLRNQEIRRKQNAVMNNMRAWWIGRMTDPKSASLEKATLFWHGHFATSTNKIQDPSMMWRQNQTLRANAFGNFGDLVKAMSRDPAMMVWLDLHTSKKEAPNENWARELMELFTLGIGHYTEDDIKNSARAFTGYRFNRQEGTFRYAVAQHDDTEKTFMGQKGNFNGDDIIDIILKQPASTAFIAEKLWRFYAYEEPEPAVIQGLSHVLRESNYDLNHAFTAMFNSAHFYSEKAIRTQIKSPAQLIAGICTEMECNPPRGGILQQTMSSLGQVLFAPPNVKGWDGNRAWINTATISVRNQLTDGLLLANRDPGQAKRLAARGAASRVNIDAIIPKEIQTDPEELVDALSFRVFQSKLTDEARQEFLDYWNAPRSDGQKRTIRDLIAHMMRTPLFQLC